MIHHGAYQALMMRDDTRHYQGPKRFHHAGFTTQTLDNTRTRQLLRVVHPNCVSELSENGIALSDALVDCSLNNFGKEICFGRDRALGVRDDVTSVEN